MNDSKRERIAEPFKDSLLNAIIEEIGTKHGLTKVQAFKFIRVWFFEVMKQYRDCDPNNYDKIPTIKIPKFGTFCKVPKYLWEKRIAGYNDVQEKRASGFYNEPNKIMTNG